MASDTLRLKRLAGKAPGLSEFKTILVPVAWPFKFNAPVIVCVTPASKVSALLAVTQVRFGKVVEPVMVDVG
ncbi:MAG: hypothetical protein KKG50_08630, partial [Candidatus Omnitrophica bacterium]|nr:hypothetical protein [Candidatus Omnitrophota bacterium]